MSDRLTALSLFLAVLGLLYSAWYNEITSAINEKLPQFPEDRKKVKDKLNSAYRFKALPLFLGSLLIEAIIFPDFIKTINEAFSILKTNGLAAFQYYDSVKTLFCVFLIFLLIFTAHLYQTLRKLTESLRKCKAKRIIK